MGDLRERKLMTGIMCALVGAGGSKYAGSTTVTVGIYYDPNPDFSFVFYGFGSTSGGAVSPSTWSATGLTINDLKYVYVYTSGNQWINFQVVGLAPNSGWTTMTVDGTALNRVDASYSYDGVNTTWTWFGASNSFGTAVGATKVVTWA